MAAIDFLTRLRQFINESDETNFTDEELLAILEGWTVDGNTNVNSAASEVWMMKAAKYAALVDITESGSSRKLSGLQANALKMSKWFKDLSDEQIIAASASSRTREIVRPT
jgi:hypothetical protein